MVEVLQVQVLLRLLQRQTMKKECSRCGEEKAILNDVGVCLDCDNGPTTFFG